MINESGTMSGGGGKPRGGRMCLGKAALCSLDTQAVAAELQAAEQELDSGTQVHQCLMGLKHLCCSCLAVGVGAGVDKEKCTPGQGRPEAVRGVRMCVKEMGQSVFVSP